MSIFNEICHFIDKSVENETNRRLKEKSTFQLIFEIYRKWRNEDSLITQFYFVIIYCEYHKKDLRAITSGLWGHLPIFGIKNLDVHLGEMEKLDLHSYFAATCSRFWNFRLFIDTLGIEFELL